MDSGLDKKAGKKFYIATAIAYSSKQPHIGNDYDPVYADAIARFKRMSGYDVFFSTGTDEHGQKIEEIAKDAGITPKESADRVTDMIYNTYKRLNISFDKFIRTTDNEHVESVKKIFVKLYENGDIYKSYYEGLYCVPCESFFTPSQIKDNGGVCPDCGEALKEEKEEAYFFKLSKYQEKLEKYIEENPDFLAPALRRREIVNNFIKPGVQDLCVSRSTIKWGVPVEFDDRHVIYVWIDALSNYITTLGYNPENKEQPELFNKYWSCDLHIIGKDIMRFHSIYWVAMLWGLGLELPKQILGHPWLLFGEEKMSKSKGNVVYSDDLTEKFGADSLRYYLLSEMPFDRDTSFTYVNFIRKYNADLVNTLSNLINRTIVMTEKYFDGVIPQADYSNCSEELDKDLKETVVSRVGNYSLLMNEYKISDAIDEILDILYRANKYIDETEPWILGKDGGDKIRLGVVLYNLLESIRIAGVLLNPIIPETSEKIFAQINTKIMDYESAFEFGGLKPGVKLNKAEPIFMRLDENKILAEVAESIKSEEKSKIKPVAAAVSEVPELLYEDFMKINLKVGLVLECEKAEKSDKLLKLQVDLGYEKRQIVSGIAKFYNPDDLIGKKVIIVSNLKEATIRGIVSKGMLLASGDEKDSGGIKVVFAPDNSVVGSRVR